MSADAMNLCASCYHRADQHIYEEGACRPGHVCPDGCEKFVPMSADRTVDPLAEVLRAFWQHGTWDDAARAARDHIAAEIEAAYNANYGIGREGRDGMMDAARIARGRTNNVETLDGTIVETYTEQ
jgi:hypothetical protein